MNPKYSLFSFSLLLFISFSTSGQYSLEGFDLSDSSRLWFDKQIGLQSQEVLTGVYEPLEGRIQRSHPFWSARHWLKSEIHYRGEQYTNVYLMYDLEMDQLLTKKDFDFGANESIRLNQEQVLWFRLGEAYFERKHDESLGLQVGFYQILFENEAFRFYAKRRKKRELDNTQVNIVSDDLFYIIRNKELHKVKSSTSLYKLFPEIKDKLKTYCRAVGIKKLAKSPSSTLTELATHCDKLLLTQ